VSENPRSINARIVGVPTTESMESMTSVGDFEFAKAGIPDRDTHSLRCYHLISATPDCYLSTTMDEVYKPSNLIRHSVIDELLKCSRHRTIPLPRKLAPLVLRCPKTMNAQLDAHEWRPVQGQRDTCVT
jgi:hypothetical protein